MKAQRLRVTFCRGAEVKYITHLDLMRFWERCLKRAGLDVAYSEGFSPHPQISLAAPLPVGVTSTAELMDVFLARPVRPEAFVQSVSGQLPPGIMLAEVQEVSLALPSIQSQIRAAEYRVELDPAIERAELERRVSELLGRASIPWHHRREKEIRSYDLRPLIHNLRAGGTPARLLLLMRLQADNAATGRPDQVVAALALPPALSIERTRLILADEAEIEAPSLSPAGATRS